MNLLLRYMIIAFLILPLLTVRLTPAWAIEDAIIAVVNNELITLKDLKDYVQSTYVSLVAEGMPDTQIKEIMMDMEINGTNKLIEDKLIISRANAVGLVVREDLVDERINALKGKYGSEQNFIAALIKNGSTLTDLRNMIRDQMKIKFIIDHDVKSKIYVNPQEVTEYYKNNKQQFNREDRINLESLFIAYGEDKETTKSRIAEILKKINAEETEFSVLVKKYSDAPSVGIIERGQLLPEVENIVFNLSVNEISPAVETDNGIFVFKLISISPAQIANLEDVKDQIHEMIYSNKFKKQFLQWIGELKKNAYIEIKP